MAYSEKYFLRGTSPDGVGFKIRILKDGFSGSTEELKLLSGSAKHSYKHSDWFQPMIGNSFTFSILNDKTDWYDLEDLMTLEEREFQIIVDASFNGEELTVFNGWINSDIITQNYFNNSTFTLTGSNYMSKLGEGFYPSIIDTIAKTSLIDILNETFKLTGKNDNILVYNTLDPSEGILGPGQTCLNICGVDTEVFWENNIERTTGTDIIDDILIPLDSYIYWWNGKWKIQRYADI